MRPPLQASQLAVDTAHTSPPPATGTITASAFWGKRNAITADAAGQMCIWRCHDWLCLHQAAAHEGEVLGVAVHRTGRLALTVGADNQCKLWELAKGACMHSADVGSTPVAVAWSPDCTQYVVVTQQEVLVHSGATGQRLHTVPHSSKPTCAVFLSDHLLATGAADCSVRVWNTEAGALQAVLPTGHANRIKALNWLPSSTLDEVEGAPEGVSDADDGPTGDLSTQAPALALRKTAEMQGGVRVAPDSGAGVLVTVGSTGTVKLWDMGPLVAPPADTPDHLPKGWAAEAAEWGGVAVVERPALQGIAPLATLWGAHGSRVTCCAVGRHIPIAKASDLQHVAAAAAQASGGVAPSALPSKAAPAPGRATAGSKATLKRSKAAKAQPAPKARGKGGPTAARFNVKKSRPVPTAGGQAAEQPAPARASGTAKGGKKRRRAEGGVAVPASSSAPSARGGAKAARTAEKQSPAAKAKPGVVNFLSKKQSRSLVRGAQRKQKRRGQRSERQAERLEARGQRQ